MKYPIMQSNRKPLIDAQEYELMYEQSISQPDEFWADQADQFISWDKKWDKVSDAVSYTHLTLPTTPYV